MKPLRPTCPPWQAMYDKLDALLRQHTYTFPPVEKPGDLWLDTFRRTLGRFSVLYVAELGPSQAGEKQPWWALSSPESSASPNTWAA